MLIRNQKIESVSTQIALPPEAIVVKTEGLIYPGLIDIHNHAPFNIFPKWKPSKHFNNRYEWKKDIEYRQRILEPYIELKRKMQWCNMTKYAEIKSLIGGTISMVIEGDYPVDRENKKCIGGLVRNVGYDSELDDGKSVGILEIETKSSEDAQRIYENLVNGDTTSLLIHLSEGTDRASLNEFNTLKEKNLLQPETAIIHGVALGEAQFKEMSQVGSKLIWSPQSNITLYNNTTDIPLAVKYNVLIALGPDGSLTGSITVLEELKIADRLNHKKFNNILSDKELVKMVTVNAAKIVDLDEKIGSIKKGMYADLVLIKGDTNDPYRSLINAKIEDIELVLIGGQPFYGDLKMMDKFVKQSDYEILNVCGREKAIDITGDRIDIPNNGQRLAELIETLKAMFADLTPLFECH